MDGVTRHVEIHPVSTMEATVTVHQDAQDTGLPTDGVTKRVALRLAKTIRAIAILLHSYRKARLRESVRKAINFNLFSITQIQFFFTSLK